MQTRALMTMVILVGAGILLSACSSTAPGYGRPDPLPADLYPQVSVSDELGKWVVVDRAIVKRDPLQVTVPVRSVVKSGDMMRIDYRYIFLDEAGAPLLIRTQWRYEELPPSRTQVFLSGNALDDASDWRLEIRVAQ